MKRVSLPVMTGFAQAIFQTAGCAAGEASIIAAHLTEASAMGHDSHGIIRIAKYIDWLHAGQVIPNQHMSLVTDRGALLVVDGNFGFGQVIGKEAMELTATRAKKHGIAAIAIRNSGHLGRIGAWPAMLAVAGLASVHFVNTSGFGILVAPHGGSDRRLSANPVAAGVPVAGGEPLVLDIATSAIAEGKIQVARNKREKLPAGVVIDGRGRPTDDPEAFYADPPGAILPFGGHKGSGLSFFCEILAGSLSGGFASNPNSPTARRLVNNMLSIAFDPQAFGSDQSFAEDVLRLVGWTKGSPPMTPGGQVLLPGEIENQTRAERQTNGLPIDDETWRGVVAAAQSLGVAIPEI